MSNYISKEAYAGVSLFIISVFFLSCINTSDQYEYDQYSIDESTIQEYYRTKLEENLEALKKLEALSTKEELSEQYLKARDAFKALEPIFAFTSAQSYNFLNGPNIIKAHEEDATNIKVLNPVGFQVIEEELFVEHPDLNKIKANAQIIHDRLQVHLKNIDLRHIQTYHVLWMIRDQIIRTALTGLTGFDSPGFQRSIEEAKISYETILEMIDLLESEMGETELTNSWASYVGTAKIALSGDFESFNRYSFIKNHTQPGLLLWNKTVEDLEVEFPFTMAINNDAESLFSAGTFNQRYFSGGINLDNLDEKIELGEKLFLDPSLSSTKEISCASCHQPEKFYTDGLVTPEGLDRNSPTLLYSGLQKAFFYDNRAGSIEGQIVSVVENEKEFHTNLTDFQKSIETDTVYRRKFGKAYSNGLTEANIRHAIASYVRSLSPFNSKFDLNMRGLENSLSESEIRGFNLFMGKAACATCHFAPLFNGTVPMLYKESEMELIGVPETRDTLDAIVDGDLGRYNLFKTENRKHFFKTPTVRNIAMTGPYMHNGVYLTLEEVMDFYNKGGAAGLGIELEFQTLPPDNLNLSQNEISDIVAFMHSLTDPVDSKLNY